MFKHIAVVGLALVSATAWADEYPSRSVTLIVPFSAGGPTDVVARQLAMAMGKNLNQTVIVDNRPSAGGVVGSETVLRAPADGYTLLIHNIGMSTLRALSPKLKFDPLKDFSYVGEVVDVPMTLVGKTALPPKNFKDLRGYLTTHQQSINISNAGVGTASHLCGLLLMSQLKLRLTMVPYKGAAPAMTDLQGGQVDLLCDQITTTLQPIRADRVKPYGTTTRQRLDSLPDLPTLNEQGLKDFEITVWHGIYAPKNTPVPVLDRLSKALQASLVDPAFRESMSKMGAMPVEASRASSEGLERRLRSQVAIWTPLIEQSQAYLQ